MCRFCSDVTGVAVLIENIFTPQGRKRSNVTRRLGRRRLRNITADASCVWFHRVIAKLAGNTVARPGKLHLKNHSLSAVVFLDFQPADVV